MTAGETTEPFDAEPPAGAAFDVVPIAITHYRPDQDEWQQLPEADDEVHGIGEVFEQWGGRFLDWKVDPADRDLTATTERLYEWASPGMPRNSVLVWVGHGTSHVGGEARLIVPAGQVNHQLEPIELARRIVDEHRRRGDSDNWAMVVIEACGAERFVELVGSILLQERVSDGVVLIGSGADLGSGFLGSFRAALNRVRASYTGNDTRINLGDFANRLARALPQGHVFPVPGSITASAVLVPPTVLVVPITTPVDAYRELRDALAKLSQTDRIHFANKGMGTHLGEFGWHFAGRETECADIVRWLVEEDHGLLVLAGPAGTGKSAILGNVLLRARPEIRTILASSNLLDGDWLDEPPPIDEALLLTGATLHEVTDRFAEFGGVDLPTGVTGSERATELVGRLRGHTGRRLTVIVDGLDEAQDAMPIAGLLREMSAIGGIRIVVGTRPRLSGQGGASRDGGEVLLAELIGQSGHVTVQAVRRDPQAIALYVARRLRAVDGLDEDTRIRVVGLVTADNGTSERGEFLHAHLAVHELLADRSLLMPTNRERLTSILDLGPRALFARALTRMGTVLPASRAFLTALAHSRGRGLPRADGLWVALACAMGGTTVSEEDLDDVLQLAGPYIMLDSADGQSVYRLAHRTFQEEYTAEPHHAGQARTFALTLLDIAAGRTELGSYLRNHLSGHLADLGLPGWNALDERPAVLDQLDIAAVVEDGMRTPGGPGRLPDGVRGAFMSAHLALAAGRADRFGLRQLGQARVAGTWSAARDDTASSEPSRDAPAWELRWAGVRRHTPHVTLAGHDGAVRALTAFPGPDDRILLASAGDDRTIRLWDPATARAVRSDLARFAGPVLALASCRKSDRTIRLVAVGDQDPVRFVDPDSGHWTALPDRAGVDRGVAVLPGTESPVVAVVGVRELSLWDDHGDLVRRTPHGHTRWVEAITVADGKHGPLLVTADRAGQVRSWSAANLTVRAEWTTESVQAITVLRRPGCSDLVVTGSDDGVIRCWNPADGQRVGPELTGHAGPVPALAALALADGGCLLASGGEDRTVRAWWLSADENLAQVDTEVLTGHTDQVSTVVAFAADGGTRLASSGRDGTVRLWTPQQAGGDQMRSPGQADGPVSTLAVTVTDDGTAVLEVTARDGSDHRWAAESGAPVTASTATEPVPAPSRACSDRVRAAIEFTDAAGRTLIAEAGQDGTVRLYDAHTARQCGPPLAGHTDWANALAVAIAPDGRQVLLTGDDTAVRMWFPGITSPAHVIPLGMRVRSLIQVGADIAVGTDEGVGVLRPRWDRIATGQADARWSDD